ncbi:CDP-diacylglycerol--serine O-phosphatidyltransferase [Prevotella pallens]|jgi:CDP-diacylglycerol-serine O-phosphatidyltransferase|nr:CDP-diacylglycerol--serine O-phosphatidyltransferase [Prevotella pallens]MBF1442624.1 CDP-diacylglycerol--serine O-phosphatidyltransferase [Prevotella pallens]MBF1457818.1 CDP-diacylglycerol--serine O-phosphatidyltransferase [Prevotella pallens]MBF1460657.1 CDP-diacylglycerol--serine O-phosphatidyltransferase [Prevotella pallens]MBF1462989.1 CDP-diacylglycerol--serine O-phosphatidyltransferase [Prevotella pallens]MBF1464768.1 CDP-diacylglycerol--serine O-phosphatidyltransferase [Prevotella 
MAIKKHIPNTITCCNLISGCIAIAYAFSGKIEISFTWIIIGAVFDFFDGMSARLLKVSSPIGKELDSLADIVTFGVAPSTILFSKLGIMSYPSLLESLRGILPFIAYIMAAFSALRLAKFNLDERQTLGFIGLPTPANALFWGSLLIGLGKRIDSSPLMCIFIIVGIFISSWLMVSEIPMFALKFKEWGWKKNQIKYIFLLTCIPLIAIFGITGFAIIVAWYVIISYIIKK